MQKDGIELQLQRCAALFKDASDHGEDVDAAPLAGERLLGLEAISLGGTLIFGAFMTLTETHIKEVL